MNHRGFDRNEMRVQNYVDVFYHIDSIGREHGDVCLDIVEFLICSPQSLLLKILLSHEKISLILTFQIILKGKVYILEQISSGKVRYVVYHGIRITMRVPEIPSTDAPDKAEIKILP